MWLHVGTVWSAMGLLSMIGIQHSSVAAESTTSQPAAVTTAPATMIDDMIGALLKRDGSSSWLGGTTSRPAPDMLMGENKPGGGHMNGVTSAWRRDSLRRSARSQQGCGYWTLPGTGELLPADPQASTNTYNRPWLNRYLQWQAEQKEAADEAIAMSDVANPSNAG